MKNEIKLKVIAGVFDGAGATGAGASAASSGTAPAGEGVTTGTQGETTAQRGSTRRAAGDKFEGVIFGKQTAPTGEGSGADNGAGADAHDAGEQTDGKGTGEADKGKKFQELIRGEFKDEYTKATQEIIDRRFRNAKENEQTLTAQKPLVDMLMQRYGITDGNMEKLIAAVENDDPTLGARAEANGVSVEQQRHMDKLERDNARFLQQERARRDSEAAEEQYRGWVEQGEALKATYPDFNLSEEAKNPDFIRALRAGGDVKMAYELTHLDEIKSAAAASSAQQAEKRVVDNIRARGTRPSENGTASQGSFTVKSDPSKWTKEEMAEVARRVRRGETINL